MRKNMKMGTRENKTDILPDGTILDLDSYDWGEFSDMKRSKKAFVIWYTMPNQAGFMDKIQAALKAGYKQKSAYCMKRIIHDDEKLQRCIKMFEDRMVKTSISDAFHLAIQEKIKRATFDVRDFYETKEIENPDTGEVFNRMMTKSFEDIPEEKSSVIDNVEINQSGIATFKLPTKEKELNDIIKMHEKYNEERSTGDYDVETTIETIKDNLQTIKTTVRVSNQVVREAAENYIEDSENQPDYD